MDFVVKLTSSFMHQNREYMPHKTNKFTNVVLVVQRKIR